MDIEIFKKVVEYNSRRIDLIHNIEYIEKNKLIFARKVELSNYPKYQGYCESTKLNIEKEQAKIIGEMVLTYLKEELEKVEAFLNSVEINIKEQ